MNKDFIKETSSFSEFEKFIYLESLRARRERLFLTTGRVYAEIGINGTADGVDADLKMEDEFLKQCTGLFVYAYHTHISNAYIDNRPVPPSWEDFSSDNMFRIRAKDKGKRVVSRVVEKNGIWQYSYNLKVLPPINLNEMVSHEQVQEGTFNERVKRLIESYARFGVLDVKFTRRAMS